MDEGVKWLSKLFEAGIDSLDIIITKEDVLRQDTSGPMSYLSPLIDNEDFAVFFREKVNIRFDDSDLLGKSLDELPEVRKYILKLDNEFPYWFYFLSKESPGLFLIHQCHMLPFLSDEDEFDLNINQFKENIINKWLPAMTEMCDFTNMSDQEMEEMCMRVYSYLKNRGKA